MELPDNFDIWAPIDPKAANQLKAEIYVRRANICLINALIEAPHHPLIWRGKIHRERLSDTIGCSATTVNDNEEIRAFVEAADLELKDSEIIQSTSELQRQLQKLYIPADNDSPLPINSAVYLIVPTSAAFKLAGRAYEGLPTIIFANGIHEQASNWLRTIRVEFGLGESTVLLYAKMLRPFLYDLRVKGIILSEVFDAHLVEWRNKLEKQNIRKRANANRAILVIFQFLVWCEQNGEITYRVGCYERAALPEPLRTTQFPITALMVYSKTGPVKWTTPLQFRTVPDSAGNRGTPSDEDMKELHRIAGRLKHSTRYTTILTIVETTGARVSELLQLKYTDIPDMDFIYKLLDDDNSRYEIELVRKGEKPKLLNFDGDTLFQMHAYLKLRDEIIKIHKRKNKDYQPPPELFLSEKTGVALLSDSVSAAVRKLAKAIGLKKIGIHRVRAKFAIDVIDRILETYLKMGVQFDPGSGWIETILQQAAAEMGHENVGSLRYYLHAALERRMRAASRAATRVSHRSHQESDTDEAQDRMVRSMLTAMDDAVAKEAAATISGITAFV